MDLNIVICGIGGQGAVYLGSFLRKYLLLKFPKAIILGTESRGVSQREGAVTASIRIQTDENSQTLYSPEIPPQSADIIIAMEPLELLRNSSLIHENTLIVTNNEPIIPKSSVKCMFKNTSDDKFHVNDHSKPKWVIEKIESLRNVIPIKSAREGVSIASIKTKSSKHFNLQSYSSTRNIIDLNLSTIVLDEVETSSNLNIVMLGLTSFITNTILDYEQLDNFIEKIFSDNEVNVQKNKQALQFGKELAVFYMKMKT